MLMATLPWPGFFFPQNPAVLFQVLFFGALFGVPQLRTGIEELLFNHVQTGWIGVCPLQSGLQPGTAVKITCVSALAVPNGGRTGQSGLDEDSFT